MGSVVRRMAATMGAALLLCSTPGRSQVDGILGDIRESKRGSTPSTPMSSAIRW